MYGYVYLTTNQLNGKIYVGQRKSDRFQQNYYGSGKYLKRAVAKYGKENFTIQQIDEALTPDELDDKEIYWINYYKSTNPEIGYNISNGGLVNRAMGGIHNPNYGKHWSGEWKSAQSKRMLERFGGHPENNPMYGKIAATHGAHWYTDGIDEVMAIECPVGYHRGRSNKSKLKISENTILSCKDKKYKWYTNGFSDMLLCDSDAIPDGYYKGKSKGGYLNHPGTSNKIWINNSTVEKYINKSDNIPEGYIPGRLRRQRHKRTNINE